MLDLLFEKTRAIPGEGSVHHAWSPTSQCYSSSKDLCHWAEQDLSPNTVISFSHSLPNCTLQEALDWVWYINTWLWTQWVRLVSNIMKSVQKSTVRRKIPHKHFLAFKNTDLSWWCLFKMHVRVSFKIISWFSAETPVIMESRTD